MVDNVQANSGSGGATLAADDIGGVHYPRTKLVLGANNTNDGDVSSANPMPVTGTLTVNSHDVTNAGTFVVQIDGAALTALQLIDDAVADEGAALSKGILLQGDDGTDRKNVNVDATTGDLQVDITHTVTVDATGQGDVPITLGGEAVVLGAGSAAIGKLAANSGVDIGDVDVTSQPARDRLTDNVGVALQTDALLDDTTALTPKFAAIDAATSGNNTLVAAVVGKKIRVLACMLQAAGTVNVRFEDGAGGTALTGQMNNVANSGFCLPFNPVGWFETSANTLLNLELSAAVSVDGCLTYVEV